jgi:hypothetical protein
MPAYRERIYICPSEDGKPGWILDFPIWWDRHEFFQKYGGRQIDTGNPFRVNYALLLTNWEANAWDGHCREKFAKDPRSQTPFFIEAMRLWEMRLSMASWVIVESYEWESGME